MRDARAMRNARRRPVNGPSGSVAHRPPLEIPGDLRARLEVARLDLLALFRALRNGRGTRVSRTVDRMHLSAAEIPQRFLRQLFELDAEYAEALWALDQPAASLDRRTTERAFRMLRDTLTALEQLPKTCARFRKKLPRHALSTLTQLEMSVRLALDPREAYNMVPGRDPENV